MKLWQEGRKTALEQIRIPYIAAPEILRAFMWITEVESANILTYTCV